MKFTTHHLLVAGASALALSAGAAQADQVFVDDVIVQGSLCVGQDCVNGESFGFDTLRLKENNLRIHAQDTSSSASFPTVDWRITFNESSNGGLNKFSVDSVDSGTIPFTIEGGAPSNALYVDDGGRIGLGEAQPVVELHIADGDTPTMRLEQDGSSGFTPQTWDVAGNETNFFIRDATNGSRLPFKIRPSAPTNSLYVDTDGDVGLSTASPDADLHVLGQALISSVDTGAAADGILHTRGTGTQLVYFESSDNGAVQVRMRSDSGNRRFLATDSADAVETQIVFTNNQIHLAGPTNSGADLWAVIDANGITTQGGTCNTTPCDRTFDPSYFEVPPIAERATYMWENMHLPAVGPTKAGDPVNITEKTTGMLHELEIAHIYIEQLDTRVKELEALVSELQ